MSKSFSILLKIISIKISFNEFIKAKLLKERNYILKKKIEKFVWYYRFVVKNHLPIFIQKAISHANKTDLNYFIKNFFMKNIVYNNIRISIYTSVCIK